MIDCRHILLIFLVFIIGACQNAASQNFQPLKTISVSRRDDKPIVKTAEMADDPFQPSTKNDTLNIFADLTNSTKRMKIQLATEKFVEKFGAQQLLNLILKKIETASIVPPQSKNAIHDFLDFVENVIYDNAAKRIEKKLKLDFSASDSAKIKQHRHVGSLSKKTRKDFEDSKFRRDAPALTHSFIGSSPHNQNSVIIDVADAPYSIVRQPIEPSKLLYLSRLGSAPQEIRRSPIRSKKMTTKNPKNRVGLRDKVIKATNTAAVRQNTSDRVKYHKVLKKNAKRKLLKHLPISKLTENNMRRSPIRGRRASFNEKMFQLLDEFGISTFRVETADYTVRAFADPRRTHFSLISLAQNPRTIENEIRRSPSRPAFIYSRTISNPSQPKQQEKIRNLKNTISNGRNFDRII